MRFAAVATAVLALVLASCGAPETEPADDAPAEPQTALPGADAPAAEESGAGGIRIGGSQAAPEPAPEAPAAATPPGTVPAAGAWILSIDAKSAEFVVTVNGVAVWLHEAPGSLEAGIPVGFALRPGENRIGLKARAREGATDASVEIALRRAPAEGDPETHAAITASTAAGTLPIEIVDGLRIADDYPRLNFWRVDPVSLDPGTTRAIAASLIALNEAARRAVEARDVTALIDLVGPVAAADRRAMVGAAADDRFRASLARQLGALFAAAGVTIEAASAIDPDNLALRAISPRHVRASRTDGQPIAGFIARDSAGTEIGRLTVEQPILGRADENFVVLFDY